MSMYVVIFDRDPAVTHRAFQDAFVAHPRIYNWWHYIKSAYLIRTDLNASELSDHYNRCARQTGISKTHLVIKLDPSDRQGMLVRDAWAWIRKNSDV
jgi:hypothetical protein